MSIVNFTLQLSLIVQIVVFIVSVNGLFFELKKKHQILKEVFIFETVVQVIEALMYTWLIFAVTSYDKMVQRRYIDWVITTPIMLITTIAFMEYVNTLKSDEYLTFSGFCYDNMNTIIIIVVCNALMLLFGYLGESKKINKYLSITIGFVFFFIVFHTIYDRYVKDQPSDSLTVNLFLFIFIVWALYGVAAFFNSKLKNICYNFFRYNF